MDGRDPASRERGRPPARSQTLPITIPPPRYRETVPIASIGQGSSSRIVQPAPQSFPARAAARSSRSVSGENVFYYSPPPSQGDSPRPSGTNVSFMYDFPRPTVPPRARMATHHRSNSSVPGLYQYSTPSHPSITAPVVYDPPTSTYVTEQTSRRVIPTTPRRASPRASTNAQTSVNLAGPSANGQGAHASLASARQPSDRSGRARAPGGPGQSRWPHRRGGGS